MKKLLFVLAFTFIGQLAFSQIYIISEKHDGFNGNVASYDSVFVTDPFGVTIAYSIPHIWIDINAHNSEFNQIINNVLNLGYQLLPSQGGSYEIVVTPASYPYGEFAYRTYFLGIPWNSTNLEEVFINYNSINTLVINPNPANEFVNISLSCYIKGENEVVFISEGGFIYHNENLGEILKNEKYNIDISKIPAGKYLITIVNGKTYTTPQKLIIF